jgi:hypothetical protein
MTDRFLITPHSTTLTYRIGEGEEITQEILFISCLILFLRLLLGFMVL